MNVKKIAVAAIGAILAISSAHASCGVTDENTASELLIEARYFDLVCRGSSQDTAESACEKRNIISKQLDACGWCYGKKGQFGYQMAWHKCTKNSYHAGD